MRQPQSSIWCSVRMWARKDVTPPATMKPTDELTSMRAAAPPSIDTSANSHRYTLIPLISPPAQRPWAMWNSTMRTHPTTGHPSLTS